MVLTKSASALRARFFIRRDFRRSSLAGRSLNLPTPLSAQCRMKGCWTGGQQIHLPAARSSWDPISNHLKTAQYWDMLVRVSSRAPPLNACIDNAAGALLFRSPELSATDVHFVIDRRRAKVQKPEHCHHLEGISGTRQAKRLRHRRVESPQAADCASL
jgi:hypothetical protein